MAEKNEGAPGWGSISIKNIKAIEKYLLLDPQLDSIQNSKQDLLPSF